MNLEDFFTENNAEVERRNRIRLSVAAYSYEFKNTSIMSDGDFDELALKINPDVSTIEHYHSDSQKERFKVLDDFFKNDFEPHTGQWIHSHPELDLLDLLYERVWNKK